MRLYQASPKNFRLVAIHHPRLPAEAQFPGHSCEMQAHRAAENWAYYRRLPDEFFDFVAKAFDSTLFLLPFNFLHNFVAFEELYSVAP